MNCLRTPVALGDHELHAVVLGKHAKALTDDSGEVNENIRTIISFDESEAPIGTEPRHSPENRTL